MEVERGVFLVADDRVSRHDAVPSQGAAGVDEHPTGEPRRPTLTWTACAHPRRSGPVSSATTTGDLVDTPLGGAVASVTLTVREAGGSPARARPCEPIHLGRKPNPTPSP